MAKIALKLDGKNPDALITFALDIHTRMLASAAVFDTPPVAMSDLKSDIDALQAAQNETLMGGRAATISRNEKLKRVVADLKKLANYVENVADEDVSIITMAGMPLRQRGPLRYDFLEKPIGLKGEGIGNGMVAVRWKRISYAKAYELEYCGDPIIDDKWQPTPLVSAASATVNGLNRKEEYWFRVRACGSKGMVSEWSSPLKVLAF